MAHVSWNSNSMRTSNPAVFCCFSPVSSFGAAQLATSPSLQFSKSCKFVSLRLYDGKHGNGRSIKLGRQPRKTSVTSAMDVPDFLPATWGKRGETRPIGPSFDFAGFDPFQRSKYFGPMFDLGQFERFRRIFHHSTYRVLLSHKERRILSSLFLDEHCFKQRVWISGARPDEEEIFEFTLAQRVGGNWDGYWLTDSLHHDGGGITGSIAY